ncbi:MAG: homocysteine methyltransferase, partial [Candidatus Neomarinimicrobiota bacterium]
SDLVTGGVRLAREVCPAGKFVAGSVGPTGEIPAPYGSLDLKTGVDLFAEPIRILAREGVDLILIETMMSLEEAEMAVRAAREVCSLPVCMSMTFEVREGRVHSAYGVTPEQWVQAAMDWQVAGVGANCGQGFAEMVTVLKAFPAGVPVFAQANAGLPVQQGTRWVYPDKPDTAKKWVEKLIALNPALIGGCCGTRPEHIRLIRTLVDAGDYDS